MGLHKGSGRARVVVNGKSIFLGRAGTPQAEEAYRRVVAELAAGQVPKAAEPAAAASGAGLTISEAMFRYTEHAERYYTKAGQPTAEVLCLRRPVRVLRETYGSLPIAEFTVQHLEALREAFIRLPRLVERKKKPTGKNSKPKKKPEPPKEPKPVLTLSRACVNGHVDRIRRAFRWCAEKGLVPAQVYLNLRVLSGLRRGRSAARETPRVLPVPWEKVEPILSHLSRQARAIVELLWWTGARVNEICSIRHGDVDRSGTVWNYRVREEANKVAHHDMERVVAFGPRAQDVLRPFLDRVPKPDPETFVFSPAEAEAERQAERHANRKLPLWPSHDPARRKARRGRPQQLTDYYTPDALRRAIERACDAAKIQTWAPGRLRHSCATRLRAELGDLQAVSCVLGHSDVQTSAIYAERDRKRAMEVMERLG